MIIQLTDPYGISLYDSNGGYFVTIRPNDIIHSIESCREEFEYSRCKLNFHNRVGFKKNKLNIELMKKFWDEIFQKLGVESKFEIHTSNFSQLVVIDVPEFWNKNETVRSLFSLLLRCSVIYYVEGDDVASSLKKYPLARFCATAIEWFLKGNTVPTYEKLTRTTHNFARIGFVAEFDGLTVNEIATKLVSK